MSGARELSGTALGWKHQYGPGNPRVVLGDPPSPRKLTSANLRRVADELRQLLACADAADREEPWFIWAESFERQLRETLCSRLGCPRFEEPDRVVIEIALLDGREAELTYEVVMWGGTKPEPSCGWVGGPEIDHVELVRIVAGDSGVPMADWAGLIPKEADALAEDAAQEFEEQLVEAYRASQQP